ncbi:MAG: amidohydrolase [Pyramidobacter sp.]|jgi:predicted amidohydrolase YtcJ
MKKFAVLNGKIYVERQRFAQALCVENGRIAAVGTNDEVRDAAGSDAEFFDCGGHTVIPGLNDSHMHLLAIGQYRAQIDLHDVRSIDELVERGKRFMAQRPNACRNGIFGVGWNQDLFTGEKRLPNRHDLDRISSEIPIVLKRVCGHIAAANTKAIEMCGLHRGSPQFPGGKFELEADGYPSGVFAEKACPPLVAIFPKPNDEEYGDMFADASNYAASVGLTAVQSNDVGQFGDDYGRLIALISRFYEDGRGKVRYHPQMSFHTVEDFRSFLAGDYGTFATHELLAPRGSLKLFKDGSLGARTALMRHQYLDDPGNFGVESLPSETMDRFCALADQAGMQVVTHAIGDGAVERTVQSYEKVLRGTNPLRHGLIHCQITDRPLLERIAKDHIPVFYQPIFLDYDMHAVISRCGTQLSSTSYAFKTVEALGGRTAYGTDSPVEDCNPFPNIYSAVTRKDKKGQPEGGFFPRECVDVFSAIDAYTVGSAYVQFCENRRGRLKIGYDADLTVLDRDIFSCDPMEIPHIKPLMTMVAGHITWSA